jgi:hypothetical protein
MLAPGRDVIHFCRVVHFAYELTEDRAYPGHTAGGVVHRG